ncbi:hypothetical protein JTB14_025956 [Gonioctena quinquepunctata]|nr:hypothetical protein JTB14_025956 [Gonioctena quinquepunctata]
MVLSSYKKGSPVSKFYIQVSVEEFLDINPRENPFCNHSPGDGWYRAFLKRHDLTHRTTEAVTAASGVVSESDIRHYVLLGDSAYSCMRNLLTPYEDTGNLSMFIRDSTKNCATAEFLLNIQ